MPNAPRSAAGAEPPPTSAWATALQNPRYPPVRLQPRVETVEKGAFRDGGSAHPGLFCVAPG
jgi:hypothetical protein